MELLDKQRLLNILHVGSKVMVDQSEERYAGRIGKVMSVDGPNENEVISVIIRLDANADHPAQDLIVFYP